MPIPPERRSPVVAPSTPSKAAKRPTVDSKTSVPKAAPKPVEPASLDPAPAKTQAAVGAAATAKKSPAKAPTGVVEQTRRGADGTKVKVITINVKAFQLSDAGDAEKKAFDALEKYVKEKDPDVILMQEVDKKTKRSNDQDQLAKFAERVGATDSQFAKAIDHDGGAYGVGVITRNGHTIRNKADGTNASERVKLPKGQGEDADGEQRVALVAPIVAPDGTEFTAITTHLASKGPGRGAQVDKLDQIVKDIRDGSKGSAAGMSSDLPTAVVLGGDFNVGRESTENHLGPEMTHVADRVESVDDTEIDHIYVSDDVDVTDARRHDFPILEWRAFHLGPVPLAPKIVSATDHPTVEATLLIK